MTYNAVIQAKNERIRALIDRANSLPDAGGSTEPDPREQYQRVEYINSDGSQYVITDFVADGNDCGMELVSSVGNMNSTATMGSRENSADTRFYVPYPLGASTTYYGFNTAPKLSPSVAINVAYRWQVNFLDSRIASVYNMDGANLASGSISGTLTPHTIPVAIFAINSGTDGGVSSAKNMCLYSARCSRGHDIVREYIPCYRKSDGEIGLYEKFTGTFLLNAGTGSFTKGPDVDW